MASVTLRTPPSNARCNFAAAMVRQHAHNGSKPQVDLGTITSALLASARWIMYVSHSRVRNGISQPMTMFHSPPVSEVASNAVMIPPRGPSPGQRSATQSAPKAAYFSREPMIITEDVTTRITEHSRASRASSPIRARALSRPKRVLPPPASTKPPTWDCPGTPSPVTGHPSRIRLFYRLPPRPPNPQLAQFFLQALPVQPNRGRRSRHIPAMTHQLLRQIRDFKFVLRFAKVFFTQAHVGSVLRSPTCDRLPRCHFLRKVQDADLVTPTEDQAAFQRVFQLAHVSWPIVTFDCRQGFPSQSRRSPES